MKIIINNKKGIIYGNPKKDYLPNSFLKFHNKNLAGEYDKNNNNKRTYIKKDSDHYIFQYNLKEVINGRFFDWSSDGRYLVSYFPRSNIIYLYDVSSIQITNKVKLLKTIYLDSEPDPNPKIIKFSPDSKKMAILYAPAPESSDSDIYGQLDIYLVDNIIINNNFIPLKTIKPSDYPELKIDLFLPNFDWSSNSTKIYIGSQTAIQNLINFNQKIQNIKTGETVGFVIVIDTNSYKIVNQIHQNYELGDFDSYFGSYIKVSPDGKKIAIKNLLNNFLYIYKNNLMNYLIDNYENIFYNINGDGFTWGPDSTKIAVAHIKDIKITDEQTTSHYYVNIYDDLSIKEPIPLATLKTDNLENNFGSTMSWSSNGLKFAVSLWINIEVNYNDVDGEQQGGRYGYTYIYNTSDFKNPVIFTETENTFYPLYLKFNSNGLVLGASGLDNLFFNLMI
jgi:hypothetical protein